MKTGLERFTAFDQRLKSEVMMLATAPCFAIVLFQIDKVRGLTGSAGD